MIPAWHRPLLTPGEVARTFGVDPKTVTRWAAAQKLTVVRTLGGVRRFVEAEVRELAAEQTTHRETGQ